MLTLLLLYTLLGLIIGSFLNVCIYRLPRGESIVFPRSHCPGCGQSIAAWDNVPVVSYLWLRGKCRRCKKPISLQYPVVEILTGLAFYVCAWKWDFTSPAYVNSILLAVIIVLIFIDYQHQILPNLITLPGLIAGILLCPFQTSSLFNDGLTQGLASIVSAHNSDPLVPWAGSILGALAGGGTLYLVASAYELVRKRQGLGMGDVKMMAMVGAFLGWRLALLTIFCGSFLGSIIGIFLILFRGNNLQTKLAFGTFLGPGAALALFGGLPFIHWYTRF